VTKKNYDYIAAVEKAICEKYGKDAAQDFRSRWGPDREKEYLEQIKKAGRKNKRNKRTNLIPSRTCPVCKTYSFSGGDDLYMNRFQCCYPCYVDFVERKEEDWKKGKRPAKDYVDGIIRGRK
jgi:hypothetical protein